MIITIPVTGATSVVPRLAAISLQLVAPCCCARASCSPPARRRNVERTAVDFIFAYYLLSATLLYSPAARRSISDSVAEISMQTFCLSVIPDLLAYVIAIAVAFIASECDSIYRSCAILYNRSRKLIIIAFAFPLVYLVPVAVYVNQQHVIQT